MLKKTIGLPAMLVAALVSGEVEAHRPVVSRSLLLEPSGTDIHVIARLRVPAKVARSWIAVSDSNRNGRAEESEQAVLRQALMERALFGVKLRIGGQNLVLHEVNAKMERSPNGSIEVMVYGRLEVPGKAAELVVSTEPGVEPIELRLIEGARRAELPSGTRLDRGAVELGSGDRLSVRLFPLDPVARDAPAQPGQRQP